MEFLIKTDYFNPKLTLTGGQAFRWRQIENNRYLGIANNHVIEIQVNADSIKLFTKDKNKTFWLEYFGTNIDYKQVIQDFSADKTLREACLYAHGLRLLKQEPFETLISFIISQNNNIKRITGIIDRLCCNFGKKIYGEYYGFPSAEVLASLDETDLAPLRAGFRAKYILDAARKVYDGNVHLNSLYEMNADNARKELMKIKGVGEKVADCVLLFAYGKGDVFPKDVHIKRVLSEFYPDGLPDCIKGNEGLAQQYLFEYIRNRKQEEKNICSVQNAGAD